MRLCAVIVAYFLAITPLFAAEPIAALPYRIDYDGLITVKATVNGGGPYDFVLDTGSTLTLVFETFADEMDFAPTGEAPRRVLGLVGFGAVDTYHIGDIALGAAAITDHIGAILPDWGAPRRTPAGIIGLDFLRQYALYFDRDASMLYLYPHGGIPKNLTRNLVSVKLTPNSFGSRYDALYTVHGRLNRSRDMTFIFDLGSASTLVNYAAAERIYSGTVIRSLGEGLTTGSRLKDIFDDRTQAKTALIKELRIGRVSWSNHGVWVYDSPLFDELNVQKLAYGLAGVDLILDRNFALDFGENNLFIARRPARG